MSELKNKLAVNPSEVPEAGTSRLWTRPSILAAGVTGTILLLGVILFVIFGKRETPPDKVNSVAADSSIDKESALKPKNSEERSTDRTEEQFKALQGKWYEVSKVIDGVDRMDGSNGNWTLEYLGQNAIVRKDGQFYASGTWTLDATKNPMEMSTKVEAGHRPGRTLFGIIKWEGEDIILCAGEAGRPERFESLPGQGYNLTRWSRKPPR